MLTIKIQFPKEAVLVDQFNLTKGIIRQGIPNLMQMKQTTTNLLETATQITLLME
jgi:hypothetical protein